MTSGPFLQGMLIIQASALRNCIVLPRVFFFYATLSRICESKSLSCLRGMKYFYSKVVLAAWKKLANSVNKLVNIEFYMTFLH
jgi:hypothetical protein